MKTLLMLMLMLLVCLSGSVPVVVACHLACDETLPMPVPPLPAPPQAVPPPILPFVVVPWPLPPLPPPVEDDALDRVLDRLDMLNDALDGLDMLKDKALDMEDPVFAPLRPPFATPILPPLGTRSCRQRYSSVLGWETVCQ